MALTLDPYRVVAGATGQWQRIFTIITTRANRLIEPIHDRMPVIFA
jgi:putative SOS response-associated peptidase YedK